MIEEIINLNVGEVIRDVDLSKYTTYKLKCIGKVLVIPNGIDELKILINYIKTNNLKYKVLGNGSNLVFVNPVYDGILIKLDKFNDLKIDGNKVSVGAGYSLMKLALKTCMMGLSGLEFATGIPGSVGGAIYMNAGAYNSDISCVLKSALLLSPDLEIVEFNNKDFKFGYRTSLLQDNGYICLSAKFNLKYGSIPLIMELVNDRKKRRIAGQPLEYPSAGSVFRNPEGDYAGRLIESIGYKGKIIGGAQVSLKHANFIINIGDATGDDVKSLISEIKNKVKETYDIDLKVEQEFVE
jgi:UDP-N-acetylmuramate dehydrogenase